MATMAQRATEIRGAHNDDRKVNHLSIFMTLPDIIVTKSELKLLTCCIAAYIVCRRVIALRLDRRYRSFVEYGAIIGSHRHGRDQRLRQKRLGQKAVVKHVDRSRPLINWRFTGALTKFCARQTSVSRGAYRKGLSCVSQANGGGDYSRSRSCGSSAMN